MLAGCYNVSASPRNAYHRWIGSCLSSNLGSSSLTSCISLSHVRMPERNWETIGWASKSSWHSCRLLSHNFSTILEFTKYASKGVVVEIAPKEEVTTSSIALTLRQESASKGNLVTSKTLKVTFSSCTRNSSFPSYISIRAHPVAWWFGFFYYFCSSYLVH